MRKRTCALSVLFCMISVHLFAQIISVDSVKPTAFFRSDSRGELSQVAWVKVDNRQADSVDVELRTFVDGVARPAENRVLASGVNDLEVLLPDLSEPADVRLSFVDPKRNRELASWSGEWQPQKKWTIHCVTYSHHDLGYGNIPHRLRRENRIENMELMLKYCDQTDDWPYESRYRAVLETSEPITTYLSFCGKKNAEALKRRINEGRIQISSIHTTVNTETLGHEVMARLFYLSNRHMVDMLGIRPSTSANFDDVIGITLPFFTFAKEAGLKNLFHGYNNPTMKFHMPAQDEPVFYMRGADGDDDNKVLVRSRYYSGDAIRPRQYAWKRPLGEDAVQMIVDFYEDEDWPFDVILSQDGWDFTLLSLDNALRIKQLNEAYAYPRMICSTMDLFFDAVRAQQDRYDIRTFEKDGNNQWADQPATDSKYFGLARKMDELVPVAEKWATLNQALGVGPYPWSDIYQAYHRLMLYHEHTAGSSALKPAFQYATEQHELRQMVRDSRWYARRVMEQSIEGISSRIATRKDNQLIVFNSLSTPNDGPVTGVLPDGWQFVRITDNETRESVDVAVENGAFTFYAKSVPPMGYKSYTLSESRSVRKTVDKDEYTVENSFYTLVFDPRTGAITSLYDKELGRELIDRDSQFKLNEYLYERYTAPGKEHVSEFYGARLTDFKVARENDRDVVHLRQAGEGCRSIEQTIILPKDAKRIDFVLDIDKSCSGRTQMMNDTGATTNKEAMYIALPFDVPNYRFRHSLLGMSAEPVVDMFDSVNTAHYAIRHFATVGNEDFGIAVAPVEAGLIEYGYPRSDAIPGLWLTENQFERNPVYPKNSSMFLYLLNNMFDVNISLSQSGLKRFTYSLTSYKNATGHEAEDFGWSVHTPMQSRFIARKQSGSLPAQSFSFVGSDCANVVCTVFKPAEQNGEGYILRLVETSGQTTDCHISIPLFEELSAVVMTDLVENDTDQRLEILDKNGFRITMPGNGVKTLRVLPVRRKEVAPPTFTATALSDMRILLTGLQSAGNQFVRIYRSEDPDFTPGLLNYVGQTAEDSYEDAPVLNFGNWMNNVLAPGTEYYYKVIAYDPDNYSSVSSTAVKVRTMDSSQKNDLPQDVASLSAILVSDVSSDNYINVHWLSNCEPDIVKYVVYRGESEDFSIEDREPLGEVNLSDNGLGSWYAFREYDHQMYPDKDVKPGRTYYYKVYAVDSAGQRSARSTCAHATTKHTSN